MAWGLCDNPPRQKVTGLFVWQPFAGMQKTAIGAAFGVHLAGGQRAAVVRRLKEHLKIR
jgi:hypothetical protein